MLRCCALRSAAWAMKFFINKNFVVKFLLLGFMVKFLFAKFFCNIDFMMRGLSCRFFDAEFLMRSFLRRGFF